MTTINVIGDIHGRTNWKEVVKEDHINVFVGDYFDPYSKVSEDDLVGNFLDIVDYKTKYPETVLLYGNHDFHYIVPEYGGTTSRYNHSASKRFKELFSEFEDLFHGVAYAPDSKHIITHAGVTRDWLDSYRHLSDFHTKESDSVPSVEELEKFINGLWWNSKGVDGLPPKSEFSFDRNCATWDFYGDTPTQSPIWIRPLSLFEHNLYKYSDVIQIVGHTQVENIVQIPRSGISGEGDKSVGIVVVDCLGYKTDSYSFDI